MARATTTSRRAAAGLRRRALLFCTALLLSAAPAQPAIARPLDAVAASSRTCTIVGTAGADALAGTRGRDILCGLGGADAVTGRGGGDVADGGPGPDRVSGDRGPDVVLGGAGNDLLQGKTGSDRLTGGPGDDELFGGAGADHLRGGPGRDGLGGGFGPDEVSGGAGRDIVFYGQRDVPVRVSIGNGANDGVAGEHDDVHSDVEDVRGGGGDDVLRGDRGSNGLFGGEGNDNLRGLGGNDVLTGGGGADRLDARDAAGSADRVGGRMAAGSVDRVECGGGEDTALVDPGDIVGPDCEHVVGGASPSPPPNHPPTGVSLSNASVEENQPAGTTVGVLSVSDADVGDTHSFALVPGAGSADNGSFQIVGSALRTAAVFDFETKSTYKIRVRALDHGTPAGQIVRPFTITVTDTSEAPVAARLTASAAEDAPKTLTLSATDPEGDDVTSFATGALSHGSLGVIGPVSCTHVGPNECTATVDFTPDPDYNGPAGFSYTASDGVHESLPATVSVTVAPVNDVPLATAGSRTAGEDTALPLDLASLVTDVETGAANLTYEIVGPPAHGAVVGTTYTPDADYNGPDSLTFRVTDRGDPDNCGAPGAACDAADSSTTETVSITVSPVNDTPQAGATSSSVDEDGALPIDLAALASDLETADANLTYTIVTPPAHGGLSGSGGSRTYTPGADFNGADSFTYTVTDRGDPDNCVAAPCDAPETSTAGTVSITVNAVNDAPVNTVPAGPVIALQNTDTPITGLSIADVDAGSNAVRLTLSVPSGTLTVGLLVPGGVGAPQVTDNGTSTVVVNASLLAINTTLADANGLVYKGSATGPDPLAVTTDDRGNTGAGGAMTDTDTLAIVVDTPPVAAPQAVTTNEDTAKTITLSASDADGDDPLSFATGGAPSHGTLGAVGPATCTHATPNVCTADVVYTPAADYSGPDSFTFTAADAFVSSLPATVSITVTAVNDAPKLENTEAGALAYTENDPATLLTATTTVTDADSADFDTGTLTVDYATGGTADDRLEILNQGQIATSGANVTHGGTTIGSFTGGTGTTPLVVTLNANATAAATEALVRAVAYRNVSDAPSSVARTARFVLTDGDGGTSAPATRAITLTAVNDVPALAAIEVGALAYTENDTPTAVTSSLTVADLDSNITGATITITTNLAPAEDVLSFTNQLGITGSYNAATGVLTLTGSATPADYQTALRAVSYSNTSENPSTLTRTVAYQVQDGPAPANLSNVQSRAITVTAVNDAPVADDETFSGAAGAIGNTTLIGDDASDGPPALSSPKKTISGDILAGDTDAEGSSLVVEPVSNQLTNDGGRVTIEADGDFVFTPAAGTSCTDHSDFFDYIVSDQNTPTPGTDSGRVTIAIAGCVWYVSNNATGNSGTSDAPFDTLAQAEAASSANETVFVFDGDNTSTGYGGDGYAMDAGERLIGEHEGLVVDPDGGGVLGSDTLHPANPGARPTLTATNADVVDLDDGNEIRGFDLDPQGTGGGIAGSAGDTGGGTIDDVNVVDTGTAGTQPALELDATTGTFNVSNLVVDSDATGVRLNNAGTVAFAPASQISITTAGAKGLDASGTNMGTSTFDDITVTGSGTGGVSMTGTTGTTNLGDGTGTDLALTTTSGATPAFSLSTAGTVTVDAAGTDNVSATGGPAIDVTGTSGAALAFDDVDSTNSANDGVNIAGLGAGTFTATSGDITGAAGIAFDLDAGSGTVTYAGAIGNGAGASAEITNRTGGAATLAGAITDSGDAGGGITLTANTGATMSFTGGMTLSTGASPALSATGGGTLNVTGAANSLATTTGTALNVANTTIGSSDLTFLSIASNGATNGVSLNTTGSSGDLTVTGSGGTCTSAATCTGGAIQSSTGAGINLTNVGGSVNLTRVSVNGGADDGIRGSSVNGLSLANSVVLNNGNAVGERGIEMTELSGSGGLSATTVSGSGESNVTITNDTSTLTAFNVTGSTIANTNMTTGDDGMLVLNTGSAAMTVSVTGSTFTDNKGDHFQASSDASSTGSTDVTFDNNTLTTTAGNDPNVVGGGITLNPASANDLSFKVRNNNIQQAFDDAINLNLDPSSTAAGSLVGTVSNNTVGTAGQAGSGSESSHTVTLRAAGAGIARVAIQNNTLREWGNEYGISVASAEGSADVDATITGNSVKNPDPVLGINGIRIDAGATAGPPVDDGIICAVLTGNDATGTGVGGLADIRLRQRFATTIRLPGYVGATDNDAAVESFVAGNNTGAPLVDATNNVAGGGGGFTGGAACATPPP